MSVTSFAKTINNVATTVASAYTAGSGSLTVADASQITLSTGEWVRVSTFRSGAPLSILKATAVSGNVLTIAGAAPNEGTAYADVNLLVGDAAELRVTAGVFTDLEAAVNNLENASNLPVFVASGTGHAKGVVPDPGASAGTTHFLREDATWVVPSSSMAIGNPVSGGTANNVLFVDGSGNLSESSSFTFTTTGGTNYLLTLGTGTSANPQMLLNYPTSGGGDFTGEMAGVQQLSFGFSNLLTWGGGTSGQNSGRAIYFYDRIASVDLGAIAGNDGGFYWGASGGKLVLRSDGSIKIGHLADTSAANDSLYYSTTSSKLVYKDSSGTVNALY